MVQKEIEKCEKYQGLAREIGGLWKSKVKVIPVVVGVLGHRNRRPTSLKLK